MTSPRLLLLVEPELSRDGWQLLRCLLARASIPRERWLHRPCLPRIVIGGGWMAPHERARQELDWFMERRGAAVGRDGPAADSLPYPPLCSAVPGLPQVQARHLWDAPSLDEAVEKPELRPVIARALVAAARQIGLRPHWDPLPQFLPKDFPDGGWVPIGSTNGGTHG